VLEGIPFNIGFCSDPDGLFIDSSSSSSSSTHHPTHQHLPLPNTPSDLTLRSDIPGRPLSLDILPPIPLSGPAPDEIDPLPPGPQDHHLDPDPNLDHFLQPSISPAALAPVTPTVIFHPRSSSSPSPSSDLPALPLLHPLPKPSSSSSSSSSSSASSASSAPTASIPASISHPPNPNPSSAAATVHTHHPSISDSDSDPAHLNPTIDTHQLMIIDPDTRAALDYLDQL
jgi:hypothetical protein